LSPCTGASERARSEHQTAIGLDHCALDSAQRCVAANPVTATRSLCVIRAEGRNHVGLRFVHWRDSGDRPAALTFDVPGMDLQSAPGPNGISTASRFTCRASVCTCPKRKCPVLAGSPRHLDSAGIPRSYEVTGFSAPTGQHDHRQPSGKSQVKGRDEVMEPYTAYFGLAASSE
jgi:hypothetical protein